MILNKTYEQYIDISINQLYKIIPLFVNKETTLPKFINSLKREFVGCASLVEREPVLTDTEIVEDGTIVRIVSVLQYIEDHIDTLTVDSLKREVYKCIDLCRVLKENVTKR